MNYFDFDDYDENFDEPGRGRERSYSDKELSDLLQAARQGSLSTDTIEDIAGYHLENNNFEEALKFLDVLVERAPYSADAWERRGLVLNNLGRYEQALAAFEQAEALNPADLELLINKGIFLDDPAASVRARYRV